MSLGVSSLGVIPLGSNVVSGVEPSGSIAPQALHLLKSRQQNMQILRQSTAIDIRLGQFVDVTDAVTPETGITLGAADQAEILKANGAATSAMAGTFAAVTGCDGWYDYTLSTSDTDTVGTLEVVVQDSSVCAYLCLLNSK